MRSILKSEPNGSSFTVKAAAALIVVLFVLFLVVLSLSILREYRDTQKRAEDRAFSASQVVSTNARWISELSRQALGRIDEALGIEVERNAAATGSIIREAIEDLPGNVKSYVVLADGRTLFSTDPSFQPIDVRDREYFSALEKGALWYVSPLLVSRLNGAQIFVFSKRIERAGKFVGAAIISFDVALLKDIWESLAFDDLSTVSLVRGDGQLIARYPLAEGPLDLSTYVLFTDYLKAHSQGIYSAVSPADSITRMVGYRRVPGTDIIALGSVSTESAYALFRRNTIVTLAFALPTALGLAGAIVWILRLLRSDQQRRAQLTDALELNRLLIKDTHHRVKNNLQAIMSMVRMHALPKELKLDLQSRVSAMSAVHEHLYRLDQFAEVNAATLIPGIVQPLSEGFGHPAEIEYDIDPLQLDHDHATPLALLVSELVTNCLKYAFPGSREPRILVRLKTAPNGELMLTVSDTGVGFDPEQASHGLGGRLIRAMVVQLGGTSSYTVENGTTFTTTISAKAVHRSREIAPPPSDVRRSA